MKSTSTKVRKNLKEKIKSGSKIKKGNYICTNCGAVWHLNDGQGLPICPLCLNKIFKKEKD